MSSTTIATSPISADPVTASPPSALDPVLGYYVLTDFRNITGLVECYNQNQVAVTSVLTDEVSKFDGATVAFLFQSKVSGVLSLGTVYTWGRSDVSTSLGITDHYIQQGDLTDANNTIRFWKLTYSGGTTFTSTGSNQFSPTGNTTGNNIFNMTVHELSGQAFPSGAVTQNGNFFTHDDNNDVPYPSTTSPASASGCMFEFYNTTNQTLSAGFVHDFAQGMNTGGWGPGQGRQLYNSGGCILGVAEDTNEFLVRVAVITPNATMAEYFRLKNTVQGNLDCALGTVTSTLDQAVCSSLLITEGSANANNIIYNLITNAAYYTSSSTTTNTTSTVSSQLLTYCTARLPGVNCDASYFQLAETLYTNGVPLTNYPELGCYYPTSSTYMVSFWSAVEASIPASAQGLVTGQPVQCVFPPCTSTSNLLHNSAILTGTTGCLSQVNCFESVNFSNSGQVVGNIGISNSSSCNSFQSTGTSTSSSTVTTTSTTSTTATAISSAVTIGIILVVVVIIIILIAVFASSSNKSAVKSSSSHKHTTKLKVNNTPKPKSVNNNNGMNNRNTIAITSSSSSNTTQPILPNGATKATNMSP